MRGWQGRRLAIGTLAGLAIASAAFAQWGFGRSRYPPRLKPPGQHDNGFSFCRLLYQSGQPGRGRWSTDYPFADINFMVRLSELTVTPSGAQRACEARRPSHRPGGMPRELCAEPPRQNTRLGAHQCRPSRRPPVARSQRIGRNVSAACQTPGTGLPAM